MSVATTVPLAGLDADDVENVFVFVADALRWDALPDRVRERGLTLRTAANALCTPQSLPTLVSGRYAPGHGVTWFHHRMAPGLDTLFDLDGTTAGFVETEWDRPLDGVLGGPPDATVADADPPFVVVEHDHGGHTPYPGLPDATPGETFRRLDGAAAVRRHYEAGVAESVDRFERRLAQLDERGLLAETLVVFTGDHGELLGERGGFVGHQMPPAPELVYVPTTFVHPSLERDVREDVLVQLADLLPTVRDALDRSPAREADAYDGQSLLAPVRRRRPSYVHGTVHPPERWRGGRLDPAFEAPSVWTGDGGHVFHRSPLYKRALTAGYDALLSGYTAAYNADRPRPATLARALATYLPRSRTFGDPAISRARARGLVEECIARDVDRREVELSADTRESLEDLGYV